MENLCNKMQGNGWDNNPVLASCIRLTASHRVLYEVYHSENHSDCSQQRGTICLAVQQIECLCDE